MKKNELQNLLKAYRKIEMVKRQPKQENEDKLNAVLEEAQDLILECTGAFDEDELQETLF